MKRLHRGCDIYHTINGKAMSIKIAKLNETFGKFPAYQTLYAISVRLAKGLRTASFKFCLAADLFAFV